ncbi:MAG: hypothetical protein IT168_04010 [Bryobacterales bacterium]|nr:hypothetical protein [Bryobacterales bacterium]
MTVLYKKAALILVPAIISLIGGLIGLGRVVATVAAQTVPLLPITVTQRVIMRSKANALGITSERAWVASPGLSVLATRYETAFAERPGFHYRVMQFEDGRKVDVFDLVKLTSTYHFPPEQTLTTAKRMALRCAYDGRRLVGEEQLAGIPAVKLQSSNSSSEITYWMHVESGCTELQSIWIWKKNGVEYARTENLLIAAQVGLADPALIQIPGDYKEDLPSAVQIAHAKLRYGSLENARAVAKTAYDRQALADSRDDSAYTASRKYVARTVGGYGPSHLWLARAVGWFGLRYTL